MEIDLAASGSDGRRVDCRNKVEGGVGSMNGIVKRIESIGIIRRRSAVEVIFIAYLNVIDCERIRIAKRGSYGTVGGGFVALKEFCQTKADQKKDRRRHRLPGEILTRS